MTKIESHMFYLNSNKGEGATVIRLFKTNDKITVYSKRVIRNVTGQLYETTMNYQTYSLRTNLHGHKYLEFRTRWGNQSVMDSSLELLYRSDFSSYPLPADCLLFIEKVVLGWFGYEYAQNRIDALKAQLLFPVRRDEICLDMSDFSKALFRIHERNRSATSALRRNDSWKSFVKQICPHTVKTDEDLAILNKNPTALIPMASMNLGYPLSEFTGHELDMLGYASDYFNPIELNLMAFSLERLTNVQRANMVDDIISLTRFFHTHMKKRTVRMANISSSRGQTIDMDAHVDVRGIPRHRRNDVALMLFASLRSQTDKWVGNATMANSIEKARTVRIPTQLVAVMKNWHISHFMDIKIETSLGVEVLNRRFMKLFNAYPLGEDKGLRYGTKGNRQFFMMDNNEYDRTYNYSISKDFVRILSTMVDKSLLRGRRFQSIEDVSHDYINEDGVAETIHGTLFSLDDVLAIIEAGASAIDKKLIRLGKKVTSENRTNYLLMENCAEDKLAWALLESGISDMRRIKALKRTKILDRELIANFQYLPDELFCELVEMHSGTSVKDLFAE